MYKPNQILMWKNKERIIVVCDLCTKEFKIKFKSAEKNRKKNGKHVCCTCKGIKLKPQNSELYWNATKRKNQSISIKESEKYKIAIKKLDKSGKKNGMFGKKHSIKTLKKMSISRIGKTGINATAWKGGKTSLNSRIKNVLQTRFNWFWEVFKRDNFTCQKCGNNKKLDAHHIKPISIIIKELLKQNTFKNEDLKFEFIINHPDVRDQNLKNGITLCRTCHREIHINWGSHNIKVK